MKVPFSATNLRRRGQGAGKLSQPHVDQAVRGCHFRRRPRVLWRMEPLSVQGTACHLQYQMKPNPGWWA